jgi:hypothetical protein
MMLLHESQIGKRVVVVPLIASATHGITVSKIEPDDEITTAVEM